MTRSLPVPSTDAIRLAQGNETLVDAVALFDVGIDWQDHHLAASLSAAAWGTPDQLGPRDRRHNVEARFARLLEPVIATDYSSRVSNSTSLRAGTLCSKPRRLSPEFVVTVSVPFPLPT